MKSLIISLILISTIICKADKYDDLVSSQVDSTKNKKDKHNYIHNHIDCIPEPQTYFYLVMGIWIISIVVMNRKNLKDNK